MSEHDVAALERRLRTLPPLLDVPPGLVAASAQAALGAPEPPAPIWGGSRRSPAWSRYRALAGVAAIAAAAAVAATIAITSRTGHPAGFQRIATLAGARNASGYVAVGRPSGAIEPVVVSIDHLRPAAADQYYEIWFQTGTQHVARVAFNTAHDATATVHLTAPTTTQWVHCWITRESITQPGNRTIIMQASSA